MFSEEKYTHYVKKKLSFLKYHYNYSKIQTLSVTEASYDYISTSLHPQNIYNREEYRKKLFVDDRTERRKELEDLNNIKILRNNRLFIVVILSGLSGVISSLLFFLSIHFIKLLSKNVESIVTIGAGLLVSLLVAALFYLFGKKLELTDEQIYAIFDERIIEGDGAIPEILEKRSAVITNSYIGYSAG